MRKSKKSLLQKIKEKEAQFFEAGRRRAEEIKEIKRVTKKKK